MWPGPEVPGPRLASWSWPHGPPGAACLTALVPGPQDSGGGGGGAAGGRVVAVAGLFPLGMWAGAGEAAGGRGLTDTSFFVEQHLGKLIGRRCSKMTQPLLLPSRRKCSLAVNSL